MLLMNKVKETLSYLVSIIIGPRYDQYSTYSWGTILEYSQLLHF